MSDQLSFEAVSKGAVLSARVNGFEVAASLDGRPKALRVDLMPFLLEGENTFEVLAQTILPSAGEEDARWLDVKLRRGAPGTPLDQGDIIAGSQVDPKITLLSAERPERVIRHAFRIDRTSHETFDFERAPSWAQDREAEGRELLKHVRAALAAKDAKALLALFSSRTTEVASATRRGNAEVEAELLEPWLEFFAEGGFTVLDDPVIFEAGLGARVVHVRGPLGLAPVRASSDKGVLALSMSFAVLRNEVRIVR